MPTMLKRLFPLLLVVLLGACATTPHDYSAFKRSNPRSILVLPPLNSTPDVKATHGMLSQMSRPLAESGYYVFPVAVVEEAFKQNGLTHPADIHAVSLTKLREIFGADAVLYVDVKKYGAVFALLSSDVVVEADARLVDLKTGEALWQGSARASSNEAGTDEFGSRGKARNKLGDLLVRAMVAQVLNNLGDRSHELAGIASERLLSAGGHGSILYGPRSPLHGKDGEPGK